MFEFIRTHQRLMQILLAVLILPSFVLFGNTDALRSIGKEAGIATVAGASITQGEFDQALREQLDRMRQMYGPQFDAKMLNTPEARQSILDELIARKAMAGEIAVKKLTISDATLQDNIAKMPGLVKDGRFDYDEYTRLLAQQGMTPAMFDQRLRQDMVLQQLLSPVQASAFVPKTVAERLSAINEQEREVQMLMLKPEEFATRVKVTDEMLKAYYEKNAAQFEIPEQISAEYVVLSNDVLAEQITVSDAEVQAYYESNKKSYTTEEQRRVSHILIGVGKEASAADKAKAKAKAADILAQVKKKPDDLAKLAKEYSDDPGSKEQGGDLEFLSRGNGLAPQFEEAAFKLKKDEISELVETEFGFHIIKVTAITPAGAKSLDDVKPQIMAEIKKQKAAKAYAEASDTFGNMLYEQADSLKPVAEKLKLKIQTVTGLTRNSKAGVPATVETNNSKFLKAIFSDDVVKKKHNTEAVEIAPNTRIAGRIIEYKAASKRPFEEVKAAIQAQVTATEAAALAEKEGIAKLAALKTADSTAGFTEAKVVSRLKNQDIPSLALVDLMRADTQKLPAFVGTHLGNAGYVIFRIGKVTAGTPDAARRASEAQQLTSMQSAQNLYSYIELLKQKAKVTVNKAAVTAPVTAAP
ncbi:SurA N-terminal domain-containing protein [Undibacterium sp. Ji42W]|uniref:SurA N-terminal domain-containing protein n=1 Tax=Undibacterium sp. Ji42W TaxID=3413039 RepID=UPI003BF041F4